MARRVARRARGALLVLGLVASTLAWVAACSPEVGRLVNPYRACNPADAGPDANPNAKTAEVDATCGTDPAYTYPP